MAKKLSKEKWIKKASEILSKPPYKWSKRSAFEYAVALSESYFEEDYVTPEDAVSEDSTYWD